MKISSLSTEIFLSRDAIRSQIIEEIKKSFDLIDVDLTKSSFLSYVINILSTLTANILFYQISVYKEFFLTKAQLDSSVMDGAASIGYTPTNATNSSLSLILSFPFRFINPVVNFEIPEGTEFDVNRIKFIMKYSLKFVVTANSMVECYKFQDNKSELIPIVIDSDSNTFNVLINVIQSTIEKYEFTIAEEATEYKFSEYNIKTKGQMSDIEVILEDSGSGISQLYTRFSSIYLMTADDYGFVVRRSDVGYTIFFGNGLIGKQPSVGGRLLISLYTTLGSKGNVIKGVVRSTPTINGTDENNNLVRIEFTTVNPSPGISGKDEPSLEKIKYNAINNLTSLHRLVSENDYMKTGSIVEDVPILENTYPVLKRSDIRTNEIQLFVVLKYNDGIVPTENIYVELDSTADHVINKYETLTYNGTDYVTPFELTTLSDLEITKYKYIANNVRYNLNLLSTNVPIDQYMFFGNYLYVQAYDNKVSFKIYFQTMEIDFNLVTCKVDVTNSTISLPMELKMDSIYQETSSPESLYGTNITVNTSKGYYEVVIEPYDILPENMEKYYFTFSHPTQGQLNQYSVDFTFRKNLDHTMLSNTLINNNGKLQIYDIPVIRKSYYDKLENKEEFEAYVFQNMLNKINFVDVRMLTDFINIKFANTSKYLKNMLLNKETRLAIDYYNASSFDHTPLTNERFTINNDNPIWSDKTNGDIAICTKTADSTSVAEWSYIKPEMDDVVYMRNIDTKYVYTDHGWIEPIFEIPILIEADVRMQDNFTIDKQSFTNNIKDTILESFKNRMVCQSHLSRSEITSVIQAIDGVDHCRLIHPTSNIFYNYNLEELSTEDLYDYTPEMLYFIKDKIIIRLVQ